MLILLPFLVALNQRKRARIKVKMPENQRRSHSPRRSSGSSKTREKSSNESSSNSKDGGSNKNRESNNFKDNNNRQERSRSFSNYNSGSKKERKFTGRCRLFVGNLVDCDEEEMKEMFSKYGEVAEVFVNKEKGFGFIRLVSQHFTENRTNK